MLNKKKTDIELLIKESGKNKEGCVIIFLYEVQVRL